MNAIPLINFPRVDEFNVYSELTLGPQFEIDGYGWHFMINAAKRSWTLFLPKRIMRFWKLWTSLCTVILNNMFCLIHVAKRKKSGRLF